MILVIISCSACKRRTPRGRMAASERYDGVFFKVLRKTTRDGQRNPAIHILILSAKFGLIHESSPIPFYEQRLTSTQLNKLKKVVQNKLRNEIKSKNIDEIYVNMGRDYMKLIADMPELRNAIWASGPIGKRAAILKGWLTAPGVVR